MQQSPTPDTTPNPTRPHGNAPSKGRARLASSARSHKAVSILVAVIGSLGLGGIFGQWAVTRLGDLVRGDTAPAGFDALYAAWRDTAVLNERLWAAGANANRQLVDGTSDTLRTPPPELQDDLEKLRKVRGDASDLAGRVRSIATTLSGPRDVLLRLVALEDTAANRILGATLEAYSRHHGEPFGGGSGGFQPIYLVSEGLRDDAVRQLSLMRQVRAGLGPHARRFHLPEPRIRGWGRLVYQHVSDTPSWEAADGGGGSLQADPQR